MRLQRTAEYFLAATVWAAFVFTVVHFSAIASIAYAAPSDGDTRELQYAELLRDNLALAKASVDEQIAVWKNLVASPGRNPIPAQIATRHTHLATASRAIDGLLGARIALDGEQVKSLASGELARLTARQTILDQTRPQTESTWIHQFDFVPIPADSRPLDGVRATLEELKHRTELDTDEWLLPRFMGANPGLEVATLPVTQGQYYMRLGKLPSNLASALERDEMALEVRPTRVQVDGRDLLLQPNNPVYLVGWMEAQDYLAAENAALDAIGDTNYRYRFLTLSESLWLRTAFGEELDPYPEGDKTRLSRYASFDRPTKRGTERVGSHDPLFTAARGGSNERLGLYDLLGGGNEFVSMTDGSFSNHGGAFRDPAKLVHRYALSDNFWSGAIRLARVPRDGSNKEFWGDTEYGANISHPAKISVVRDLIRGLFGRTAAQHTRAPRRRP